MLCIYGSRDRRRASTCGTSWPSRGQGALHPESGAVAGHSATCANAATGRCAFAAADVAHLVTFKVLRNGLGGHTQYSHNTHIQKSFSQANLLCAINSPTIKTLCPTCEVPTEGVDPSAAKAVLHSTPYDASCVPKT